MATGAKFFNIPKGAQSNTQLDSFLNSIGRNNLISIDAFGTTENSITIVVVYETSSLSVVTASPLNGASGVDVDTPLIITFDKEISTTSSSLIPYIELIRDGTVVSLTSSNLTVSNSQLKITGMTTVANVSYQLVLKKGLPALNSEVTLQTDLTLFWRTA